MRMYLTVILRVPNIAQPGAAEAPRPRPRAAPVRPAESARAAPLRASLGGELTLEAGGSGGTAVNARRAIRRPPRERGAAFARIALAFGLVSALLFLLVTAALTGSGGDGVREALAADTPTSTPTNTPQPIVLMAPAVAGDTVLQVSSTAGLGIGDTITINPGGANQETELISGFGSILLSTPLTFNHAAGEIVVRTSFVTPTFTATATDTP